MKYRVSLSDLFKQQIAQIKEMDDVLTWKRVAQNIKTTANDLEKMEKSGMTIEATRIKHKVPNTLYAVVYKVKTNPHKVLVVKKILKHK